MTISELVEIRIKLIREHQYKDSLSNRLAALHDLKTRTSEEEAEYSLLRRALTKKIQAELALKRAKNIVALRVDADRKSLNHGKILIGVAAIILAKEDAALFERLREVACEIPAAKADVIEKLLCGVFV